MTKQCPNCGTEIDKQEEVCPKCGFTFNDKQADKTSSQKNNDDNQQKKEEDTSSFLNKEQNENIEWSELKDMSIGHVMTMFNEQEPEKPKEEQEQVDNETASESELDSAAIEAEKTSESDSEITEEKADKVMLDQYINEHKNEKQEHTSEISDNDSEKISETDLETDTEEQTNISTDSFDATEEKQVEVKKDEQEATTKKEEIKQSSDAKQKNAIDKFTPPTEKYENKQVMGPKALPAKSPEIPSKSKKPEEIEMDAAPIFFKDGEDPKIQKNKSQFDKPASKSTVQKSTSPDQENKPVKKNYKKMSIVLAAVVVLAGGTWFAYSQTQKTDTAETQVSETQEKLAEQTEKELNGYFTDDKQLFIKPEMVSVSPDSIKGNLDKLKDDAQYKELEALYKKVTEKQAAITQVNDLFIEPIIDGAKLADASLKADKKIDMVNREEKDDFDKLINQAIAQATEQYDQLQKAKAAIDVFYKNNELTAALTRDTYTAAKTEVDKVKSETLRNPLNEVLVKANTALTNAETAAAAQQQAAAQAAAQNNETGQAANDSTSAGQSGTTNGQQPDSNTFSAANADGVYTDPVYSVNPSDVADMSNPAWIWAPGVQEKVIATCIERGYIVAGGYTLQPARIINGEGYYNLYGADGQYLVTINAKTGWFKGNASRNAGR